MVRILDASISQHEGSRWTFEQLAEAYLFDGKHEKAIAAANQAIKLDPKSHVACAVIACCRFLHGSPVATFNALRACRNLGGLQDKTRQCRSAMHKLFTPSVVGAIRSCGIDVDRVLAKIARSSGSVVDYYPDGTIELNQLAYAIWHDEAFVYAVSIHSFLSGNELNVRSGRRLFEAGSESLDAFPLWYFSFYLWGELASKRDGGLPVHCRAPSVANSESQLTDNIPVTICFQRRLSAAQRDRLAGAVGQWASSVSRAGILGEGSAKLTDGTLYCYGRAVQFNVDFSNSGQKTVNWLLLSLLEFCRINMIDDIRVNIKPLSDPQHPANTAFLREQPVIVPIGPTNCAQLCPNAGQSSCEASMQYEPDNFHSPSWLNDVRSDCFPVICRDDTCDGELKFTVRFASKLTHPLQRSMLRLIRSWLDLGVYGSYGLSGFKRATRPKYHDSEASITFKCDIGATDLTLAMQILIRALEQWHSNVSPIEAVLVNDAG